MSVLNKRITLQGAVDTTMSFAQPTGSSLTWSTPSSQIAPAGTAYSGTSTAPLPSGNYWTNTTGTVTVGAANVSATVAVSGGTATVTYTGTQPAADQAGITTSVSGLTYAALQTNGAYAGGDFAQLYDSGTGTYQSQQGINGSISWPGVIGDWTLEVFGSPQIYRYPYGYVSPTVAGLFPNPKTINSSTHPSGITLNLGLSCDQGFTGVANYYWRVTKPGYYSKTVNFHRTTYV
jgi:hypothetical protein